MSRLSLTLTLPPLGLAVALFAACGEDPAPVDAGPGPVDAGAAPDQGVPDAEVDAGEDAGTDAGEDAGTRDLGPTDTGYYCVGEDGTEEVAGEPVVVPEAEAAPTTAGGSTPSTSCIDRRVTPFGRFRAVCFTQCADFLGFEPTAAQIEAIEIDVFDAEPREGLPPVDPSFDPVTGDERSPDRRLDAGARIVPSDGNTCPSGYQVEMGFLSEGGEIPSQTRHVFRIRDRSSEAPVWATTYVWDFIRQNEQLDQLGTDCSAGVGDARIPERGNAFTVVPAALLDAAAETGQVEVPGADDLFDGSGAGYAMVETRDCSSVGALTAHLTVGLRPAALAGGYLTADGAWISTSSRAGTTDRGLYLGLGAAPLSGATETRAAVGVDRAGACTETLYGKAFSMFPDAVTFVRMDREATIQPVE